MGAAADAVPPNAKSSSMLSSSESGAYEDSMEDEIADEIDEDDDDEYSDSGSINGAEQIAQWDVEEVCEWVADDVKLPQFVVRDLLK
jgi:hypothetical protein